VDDLALLAANDQDPLGGDTSRVTFDARAGTRYEIAVDGWNAESGEVVLRLNMRPAPPVLSQPRILADGAFQFTLTGASNSSVTIEARGNLSSGAWLPTSTNTIGFGGVLTFVDPALVQSPQRLYRARLRE
jgi:hypothetical protein